MSEQKKITLYSYALSPFAAKVHCFLNFKGLGFDTFYVNPLKVASELPLGKQIPVLAIGSQIRNDSTPIGIWLDEEFPDLPRLLPKDGPDRDKALEIDSWVSERLIPATFRLMLADGASLIDRYRNRSIGCSILNATVPAGVPLILRVIYPLIISRPGFIQRLLKKGEREKSLGKLFAERYQELEAKIGKGPFLAGQSKPGLADLSVFAQLALPYLAGYDHGDTFLSWPRIKTWADAVHERLAKGPALLTPSLASSVRVWHS